MRAAVANGINESAPLSMDEAGCVTAAWTTAFRMLFTRGHAEPGESVLIQGAGGSVATAAAALARDAGLRVIVTSRSGDKRRRALEQGTHEAVEQIHAAFERVQQPDLYGKVVVRVGAA